MIAMMNELPVWMPLTILAFACGPEQPVMHPPTDIGTQDKARSSAAGDSRGISAMERRFQEAAAGLEGIPNRCSDTCCVMEQEGEIFLRLGILEKTKEVHAALLSLLEEPPTPAVLSLTLMQLSDFRDATDLPVFEARLGDTRPTWKVSASPIGQSATVCYPISKWEDLPVSAAAWSGITVLLGRTFSSETEYRSWRAQTHDGVDSIAYWSSRIPTSATSPLCDFAVSEAASRNPLILAGLAAKRDPGDFAAEPSCPSPAQIRAALEADAKQVLLSDFLHAPSDPLFSKAGDKEAVDLWILKYAAQLLSPKDADAVESLLNAPPYENDAYKGTVAAAAATLDPSRRERLLRLWGNDLQNPPAVFCILYASVFPDDAKILEWLAPLTQEDLCQRETRARGVLAGLAKTGEKGRSALAKALFDPTLKLNERPYFVSLLADTAVSLGESSDLFSCRLKLRSSRCLKITAEQAEQNRASEADALPECIDALKRRFPISGSR